ncbi:MAG: hypothetical protein ACE5JS_13395 [Nitrospinota bacterium]
MTTPLIQQVKKCGGISPKRSEPAVEFEELGREYRAFGLHGVIYANGKGRGADDIWADLDPDIQADAEYMAARETGTGGSNHAPAGRLDV